ncbi:hypothetical protein [Chishuiella sp.]|uniref:hypothetical protein n=1 Tax=Chishuiella sp. TaxID=1969467 RepID=UPI0028A9FEB2|nr:hypothetical protein [Chishuiella sp.]
MKNKPIYKILFLASLVGFTLQSCAQNKEDKKIDINQMEKDIVQKEFGYNFRLEYDHNNCSYEILINDVPLITFYGLGERSTTASINQYLLKPGKQEITIRMSPKKIEDTQFNKNLDSTSFVKLKLKKLKNGSPEWNLSNINRDWEEVFVYQTPKLEKDVPFAEFKIPFEATKDELTWEIKGWSESQTLVNNEALKKEVFDFYTNFQKTIEDQNKNAYINLLAHSIFEEASADSWDSKAFIKEGMEQMYNAPMPKQKFLFPINEDTAELKFYGDGKVVTLVSKDPRSFGYSPLVAKAEKNNFPIAYTFYLHKPKGSNKLEIIR